MVMWLRRIILDVNWEWIIRPLGVPFAAGAALMTWEIMRDGWSPTTVVLFTSMTAVVFVVIDRLGSWVRGSSKRAVHNQAPQKLSTTLLGWLGKHGFPSAEEINPKPEFLFWLNCRDRQNRPFNVYVEKAHPEQVHITMGIGFSSEHTTVIENAKLQEDVIGDKVIELSRLVVPFQDLKWPIATAFGISIMLPLDETFIIAKFFDEITRVRNAAIVSATIGMSYVRKATPTKPTTRRGTSRC